MRITACSILACTEPIDQACELILKRSGGRNRIVATFEDKSVSELFTYYTDELTFVPGDFIGKTKQEALALFQERDMAYLRS